MSHIVEIKTEVRDPVAIAAACRRLALPEPVQGTASLFEAEATGLLVQLPGWLYPIVIDPATARRPVRPLQRRLGQSRAARPLPPDLCGGEGRDRGAETGLFRGGPNAQRWLDSRDHRRRRWRMKTIEIVVDPKGGTVVRTRGFEGPECREASRFVEQALGAKRAETLTPEFYQEQRPDQRLEQSQG